MMYIKKSLDELINVLNRTSEIEDQILKVAEVIINAFTNNQTLFICGNGGSASDAQHFAAELVGYFELNKTPLPVISLNTDTSVLTSVGNDIGFNEIYSRQIEALGKENDLLIICSTSGNSENIINSIKAAKKRKMLTIGLLGKGGGKAIEILDIGILVSSERTCRIQEVHIFILHLICELIDKKFGKE